MSHILVPDSFFNEISQWSKQNLLQEYLPKNYHKVGLRFYHIHVFIFVFSFWVSMWDLTSLDWLWLLSASQQLVFRTVGFSGADIRNLVNESAIMSVSTKLQIISLVPEYILYTLHYLGSEIIIGNKIMPMSLSVFLFFLCSGKARYSLPWNMRKSEYYFLIILPWSDIMYI